MITPQDVEIKAPQGWFSQFDAEIFIPEVKKIPKYGVYMEVGVHKGRSLWTARQVTKPSVEIWGVDIEEDPKIKGTSFIQGDSRTIKLAKTVDVIFIDGDHSYEGCKADVDNWYPQMKENGVMLFHDADDTSPGVVQAIEEFVKDNKLTVWYSPEQRCSMAKVQL